jgi:archaellum component FlaC
MVIEFSLWQIFSGAVSLLGLFFGMAKVLFIQFEKRQAELFAGMEKRDTEINERIDTLTTRLEEMDRGLRAMKSDTSRHLRYNDLQQVYDRLNDVDGKLNKLMGQFQGNNDTLRLILGKITEKGLQ